MFAELHDDGVHQEDVDLQFAASNGRAPPAMAVGEPLHRNLATSKNDLSAFVDAKLQAMDAAPPSTTTSGTATPDAPPTAATESHSPARGTFELRDIIAPAPLEAVAEPPADDTKPVENDFKPLDASVEATTDHDDVDDDDVVMGGDMIGDMTGKVDEADAIADLLENEEPSNLEDTKKQVLEPSVGKLEPSVAMRPAPMHHSVELMERRSPSVVKKKLLSPSTKAIRVASSASMGKKKLHLHASAPVPRRLTPAYVAVKAREASAGTVKVLEAAVSAPAVLRLLPSMPVALKFLAPSFALLLSRRVEPSVASPLPLLEPAYTVSALPLEAAVTTLRQGLAPAYRKLKRLEPSAFELKRLILEPAYPALDLEPSCVESSLTDLLEPAYALPKHLEPSVAQRRTLEPSTCRQRTLEPSCLAPRRVLEPSCAKFHRRLQPSVTCFARGAPLEASGPTMAYADYGVDAVFGALPYHLVASDGDYSDSE